MPTLSGFKLALIGLVLFMGLSAGGLLLYTYLNAPNPSRNQGQLGNISKNTPEAPPAPVTPNPPAATSASPPSKSAVGTSETGPTDANHRPRNTGFGNPAFPETTANDADLPGPAATNPSSNTTFPPTTIPQDTERPYQPPKPIGPGGIISQNPGDIGGTPITGPIVPRSLIDTTPPGFDQNGSTSILHTPQVRKEILPDRYFFNNLATSALSANKVAIKGSAENEIDIKKFAPRGEDIEAVIMDNVAGNNFEIPVAAAVWYDFYYQRHLLLPVGTKLLGTAAKGKFRNRLNIRFERAIFTDGRSLSLTGLGLDQDGTVGVPGQLIGNVLLDNLGPLFLDAVASIADRLKQRQQELLTTTSTGVFGSTQTQSNQQVETNTVQNALLDASTNVIQKINQLISQDIEENKPFVLVPAGTRVRIRLMANLDVSVADYGK